MKSYKDQGRLNKKNGRDFELRVRKDLEDKDWIVSKWMNQVDIESNKLIPAKHKFAGPGRPMSIGTGFVDFLAMRNISGKEILEILKND